MFVVKTRQEQQAENLAWKDL